MKPIVFAVLTGAIVLMAWPVVDEPDEPALEFIDTAETDWTGRRVAWVGDATKRNAILMSAVWSGSVHR